MKKLTLLMMIAAIAVTASAQVRITGIMDGTLSGGLPKAIELYITGTENLSDYTLERSANGGDWAGAEGRPTRRSPQCLADC